MKTKVDYMEMFDTYVKEMNQHDDASKIGLPDYKDVSCEFLDLLDTYTDECFSAYETNDLDYLKELLDSHRLFRRRLTEWLRGYSDQVVVLSSKFVQTYNIFNKILQLNVSKEKLENQMDIIIKSYSKSKDILLYLYNHAHVRHRDLVNELNVSRSTLTDTLRVLERYDIIERIGKEKCSLYNLTNEGRKYVRNNMDIADDEIVIDYDAFQKDSYNMVRNKELYYSDMETGISFKMYQRDISDFHFENQYGNSTIKEYMR